MWHEIIIFLQDSICTASQLDCVNNLQVDTSSCEKHCSGLLVTGFTKSQLNEIEIKDITEGEGLKSVFDAYYKYKKIESPGKYEM